MKSDISFYIYCEIVSRIHDLIRKQASHNNMKIKKLEYVANVNFNCVNKVGGKYIKNSLETKKMLRLHLEEIKSRQLKNYHYRPLLIKNITFEYLNYYCNIHDFAEKRNGKRDELNFKEGTTFKRINIKKIIQEKQLNNGPLYQFFKDKNIEFIEAKITFIVVN